MKKLLTLIVLSIFLSARGKPIEHEYLLDIDKIDWPTFMARHDFYWEDNIQADSIKPSSSKPGYYSGALMGNGWIGTNLYKLKDNTYRLNIGRSDITETRKPYGLYNSARLPIGYFTITTVGKVKKERMHLSLYNAITDGSFETEEGVLSFETYVHSQKNIVIFETAATEKEKDFVWGFTPLEAISPRYIFRQGQPADYLNHQGHSNPAPTSFTKEDIHYLCQPLASDTTFTCINKVYVVAWKEMRKENRRLIIATLQQENTQEDAVQKAEKAIYAAFDTPIRELTGTHTTWWNNFYRQAAFLSFPDPRFESFYWRQYYKFASTARPDAPIVDLQGVWPTWDTPWPAIWMNLNIQLTYSWQVKANLGQLSQPLWDAMYEHRDNLVRNVTDIPSQSTWTDAACLPRTATYDFHASLNPKTAETNQYEVGNMSWTLFYYWQQCVAYGDEEQLTQKLFPLLKKAINLFFHIRTKKNGVYGLPSTASPEYIINGSIGSNANYDLANLRWGLQTLLDIDTRYHLNDTMHDKWQNFLDNLTDFPYSQRTGFKISDKYEFLNTDHRHYSHLFMIYPYHLLDWENPIHRARMDKSINRWKGNQGYSRTGKAAMLASRGDGDLALAELDTFYCHFLKPNTLYAETGPVIETPLAAVSSLHEFYLQDWGEKIRVFYGMPHVWKDARFINMRAKGAFLISALRTKGKTAFIRIHSEKGNPCTLQTGMNLKKITVINEQGQVLPFQVLDEKSGTILLHTQRGENIQIKHIG
ncbi:MAG: hypothetical protein PUF62_05980 [Bacteroidales bacterium]|nr:hypothetical protein [Bacteroidales bacterium]